MSRVTLAKPRDLALVIAQHRDDGIGPEALSVFADAPAFIFDAAFARGGFELALAASPTARSSGP